MSVGAVNLNNIGFGKVTAARSAGTFATPPEGSENFVKSNFKPSLGAPACEDWCNANELLGATKLRHIVTA